MRLELVEYGNDLNLMPMPQLTEREMNMFMKILTSIKTQRSVTIKADEFFDNLTSGNESYKQITEKFNKFADKILTFNIKYETKDKLYDFICFEKLVYDLKTREVSITAQKDFYELFSNSIAGYTQFELLEFISVKSKYSKTLYRILKQWRNTGKCAIFKNKWDDFIHIMQIPSSYKQCDIDKRILEPSIKELSKYFPKLSYKKIKDSKGSGGRVIGIEFEFVVKEVLENTEK